MKAIYVIAGIFLCYLPLFSQEYTSSVAVPNLEISDISLADQNGNMIIEANESCTLGFKLNNTGQRSANSIRVKLSHTANKDIDIKYKKSRTILVLNAKSTLEVAIPMVAGEIMPDDELEFKIDVLEVNGFDAYPVNIQFTTAQGNFDPDNTLWDNLFANTQEDTVPTTETVQSATGTKTLKDTSSLVIQSFQFVDQNQNDILEAYESSQIQFRLYNLGEDAIQNIVVFIKQKNDQVTGIKHYKSFDIGDYPSYYMQDISIPLKGTKNLSNGVAEFDIYITEADGIESNHHKFEIKTRSYSAPELKIISADFSSAEDNNILLTEPIDLHLIIKNTGKGTAYRVKAELKLLYENIEFFNTKPLIKIDEIQAGEIKEIHFQMIANKDYFLPEIPVLFELSEYTSDAFIDTMFMASIHNPEERKVIPVEEMQAESEVIDPEETDETNTSLAQIALPILELHSLEFIDQDKNNLINVEESCIIKFNVKNSGMKSGEDVYVHITQLNSSISELKFPESIELGAINPGEDRVVNIPVRSVGLLPKDVAEFRIDVLESNGLDALPLIFKVETAELLEPNISVSYSDFLNETSVLRRNYPIELKVTVKNSGPGKAADINVKFELPEDEGCVLLGEKDEYDLEMLESGSSKSFSLLFTATRRYIPDQIPVKVVISESFRKYGIDTLLVGDLSAEAQAITTHKVTPRIIEQKEIEVTPEQPFTTQTSESRGGDDPLKGLGYEEAIKDMEIGRYFYLIIGIDDYQGVWSPLNNAVRDAISFESMIRSKYKFDNIRALHNSMATEENIIRELEWLVRNVAPNDNVLIFYSGHGEYKKELNRGFWVPVDATSEFTSDYISNSVIQDYLKAMKSRHTLLISDACFSGDIFRGETISIPFEKTERYYRNVHIKMSRQAITSGGIEPVMDGGKDGHSVFSYYLLKSLEINRERFFDASQLYNDLKIPVVNNSNQSPDFQHLKNTGDEGGQFIFISKE